MSRTKTVGIGIALTLVGLAGLIAHGATVDDDNTTSTGTSLREPPSGTNAAATPATASTAWHNLAPNGAEEVEHFETLAEMADTTDVVVTGTVTAAEPGRVIVDSAPVEDGLAYQYLTVTVDVQDDLADASRAQYTVEFGPYVANDLAQAAWPADLVGDTGIFVLRRKGSANPDTGAPKVAAEFALNAYRLVSGQGLLLDDGGQVAAPLADEAGFPHHLEGADYADVVARVDDLAS